MQIFKISPSEVLNWHAIDMDRRVSDLKEPTFNLKSLSQRNCDAWIPASYYQYGNRLTVQPRPIINTTKGLQ